MGDSITDGVIYKLEKSKNPPPTPQIYQFFFRLDKGDFVDLDEIIAIIETEKVKVDIRSGQAGTLSNLFAKEGDTVAVGKPLYEIDDAGKKPEAAKTEAPPQQAQKETAAPKPAAKTPAPQAAAKETKPKTPAGKAQSSEPKSIKKKKNFF